MLRLGIDDMWVIRSGLTDEYLLIFLAFSMFVLGACIGSFLNVCIWRMPQGESVSDAPSHCTKCGYELRWFDNIPIWSFLSLRCACRNCRQPISWQYITVETLTGLLFAGLFLKVALLNQFPAYLASYCVMSALIVTTIWIDFKHRLIPDATTYPAIVFGLIIAVVLPKTWGTNNILLSLFFAVLSLVIAGGFPAIFAFAGQKITGKEVLGWGDVKFMAACGILLGLPAAFFTLFTGSVAGLVYGIILAKTHHRKLGKTHIPLGPFLALAALVYMFAGEAILKFYLQHSH